MFICHFLGIGKTVKEKVCVHTSRDIRAIASQLVNVWIEVFRKEKSANSVHKLLRQTNASDSSKHNAQDHIAGKQPLSIANETSDKKGTTSLSNTKKKADKSSLTSPGSKSKCSLDNEANVMSAEENAAFAAAEAAHAAALAAAEVC